MTRAMQREPSFIRRISQERIETRVQPSTMLIICLCFFVSVGVQIFYPILHSFLADVFCRVDFLMPLCQKPMEKLPPDRNRRKLLPQERLKRLSYLEEPLPVDRWRKDKEEWGVVRQLDPEREELIQRDPAVVREALAALNQAKNIRKSGHHKKAGIIMEHALAMAPYHPDILTEYGIHMESGQNLIEAEGFYTRALTYNPKHLEALSRRARTQPLVAAMDSKMLREIRKKRDTFSSLPRCGVLRKAMRESYFSHIYHTVAIEGNTLSLGQTRSILESGMAVAGKSIHEHNEVIGMDSALRFLNTSLIHADGITLEDILEMHRRVLGNAQPLDAGRMRDTQVYVGRFTPVAPQYVREQMNELIEWMNHKNTQEMDPVELAAVAHYKLVIVHPFVDGNGRTARLLLNLILMKSGFPPVILPVESRAEYYATLHTANLGDLRPFVRYVAKHVDKTLQSYINLVSTCEGGECPTSPELSSDAIGDQDYS